MKMRRLYVGLAALAVGAAVLSLPSPEANGAPGMCDHRGFEHIQRHGGKEEDDRWHRAHGQQVTCDRDKNDGNPDHADKNPEEDHHDLPRVIDRRDDQRDDDDHQIPRRDHHGYHCTWRGCG